MVSPRSVIRNIQPILGNGTASIVRDLVKGDLSAITFDIVLQAANSNDAVALQALQAVGRWSGLGIANLVNAFNPELVVLGGALAQASQILTPVIEATVKENALRQPQETLKIATSAYGSEGCTVGAVAIVLDEILRYPFP